MGHKIHYVCPEPTEVVSFDPADDSLYWTKIKRIDESWDRSSLLYEGDCKISAFDIRLYIDFLSFTFAFFGPTAKDMETWIDEGIQRDLDFQLELFFRNNDKGFEYLVHESGNSRTT